ILEAQAPESAQKNINLKILSELKVIAPDIEEQNKFATFVVQVDKLKSEVQKSLDETQLLMDSLMQKYFG
ncbi:MAG: restriction endonuclease subunit S, partial [Lachnospiraceae bacterium]|nr:restriction endonuclease subunit S [Lachnospiraceae bacterium]